MSACLGGEGGLWGEEVPGLSPRRGVKWRTAVQGQFNEKGLNRSLDHRLRNSTRHPANFHRFAKLVERCWGGSSQTFVERIIAIAELFGPIYLNILPTSKHIISIIDNG